MGWTHGRHVGAALVVALALGGGAAGESVVLRPPEYAKSVDLYGAPVGSHGWLTLQAPADVGTFKEAILFLEVDDIDQAEEAELVLNGEHRIEWAKSMLGEAKHAGAIPIAIEMLRPGTNDLRFTFQSNLGGSTKGFTILGAEVRLYRELSAEERERVVESANAVGAVSAAAVDLTGTRMVEEAPAASEAPKAADVEDFFEGEALGRWRAEGGKWDVTQDIDIYDLRERDIYRSPEEPSHLRWVGLAKGAKGMMQVSISQLTGNLGLAPSYRPCHWRDEAQWAQMSKEHNLWIGPEDAIPTTKSERPTLLSADGGETWVNAAETDMTFEPSESKGDVGSCYRELQCRDGRVLLNPRWFEWRHHGNEIGLKTDQEAHRKYLLGIKESLDGGKTWSAIQWLRPEGSDPQLIQETSEECAMLELGDGRILTIVRCDPGSPCQTYLTRDAEGRYHATVPVRLPMGHSGIPEVTRGSDGVIWYWGLDGHWYTEDDGVTWRKMPFFLSQYYGMMTEAAPNTMLCVTQHLIHDSPYPYWYDSTVRMYRFSWRRAGIMKQEETGKGLSLLVRKEPESGDLHMRADVRVDGVAGIACHVQGDMKGYYTLAIVLPGSSAFARYFPPKAQAETLAANYGGDDLTKPTGAQPMIVLSRVEGDKVTVLRGMQTPELGPGSWVRLQLKVSGDIIQGAVNTEPAVYVSARDGTFNTGRVGVVTDQSSGAFRNVGIWKEPQMIRDLWE